MSKAKVIVALSGGVDSAVSAYLLQKQGYELVAVFMNNWDDYLNNSFQQKAVCTQGQDWSDAQQVAKHLSISIHKVNFIQEYWDKVFLKFLRDLKQGLTPNPDIFCNSTIKFLALAEYVKDKFDPDYIATGHYANITKTNDKYYLSKSKDQNKDQTYFLCQIPKSILGRLIFPLANFNKSEVRQIAKEIGLINAQKKDSTGICFIGKRNFKQFLANYLDFKIGKIIDVEDGQVKGQHSGAYYFTIGQRHGVGITGQKVPYYVVGKDVVNNIVYVAKGWQNSWLCSNYCWIEKVNWLVGNEELSNYYNSWKVTAKFRYLQREAKVKLVPCSESDRIKIEFFEKQRAITPGQYAVFYFNNICLGGGMITVTEKLDSYSRLASMNYEN